MRILILLKLIQIVSKRTSKPIIQNSWMHMPVHYITKEREYCCNFVRILALLNFREYILINLYPKYLIPDQINRKI